MNTTKYTNENTKQRNHKGCLDELHSVNPAEHHTNIISNSVSLLVCDDWRILTHFMLSQLSK